MTRSVLIALALVAACPTSSELPAVEEDLPVDAGPDAGPPPVACEFMGDGVCDEPANCPLGTDEPDCSAACASASEASMHLLGAACAHRVPLPAPPDDGQPSGGTGGLTGTFDATIDVPSGEDPKRIVKRHYRLLVPRAYDPSRSTPLIITMAGHRVTHYSLADYTQLPRTADQNGFLLVLAEQEWRNAIEPRWAWWTDWDWAKKAEQNPDFIFIGGIIDRVAQSYNVDLRRVFLGGHSRGAAMSFIAALEMSDRIAGACVESGFTEFGYLDARLQTWSKRKVPMFLVHGVQDPDVTIKYADAMVARLKDLGWKEGEDLIFNRFEGVKHRWQPWLNQQAWDFLSARPRPVE